MYVLSALVVIYTAYIWWKLFRDRTARLLLLCAFFVTGFVIFDAVPVIVLYGKQQWDPVEVGHLFGGVVLITAIWMAILQRRRGFMIVIAFWMAANLIKSIRLAQQHHSIYVDVAIVMTIGAVLSIGYVVSFRRDLLQARRKDVSKTFE